MDFDYVQEFDYVIVGGGSAGAVLASRLSEDPAVQVCLLEAGNRGDGLLVRMPLGTVAMVSDRFRKTNNWAFYTTPQPGLNGRKGYQPRGKALGGSSAINAMVYTRGHPKDYQRWVDDGCTGWGYKDLLPYFKKAENNVRGGDEFHGDSGPLQVTDPVSPRPVTQDFVDAGVAAGLEATNDFNGASQSGIGHYQLTQFHDHRRGQRCSTAAAYLHPNLDRKNLTVITDAHVLKVLFNRNTAAGVEYQQSGKRLSVKARRETILCAGAFQSPQLLMLSGVGPKQQLSEHGIDTVALNEGVGDNLQDHPDIVLSYKVNTTNVLGVGVRGFAKVAASLFQWFKNGKGLCSTNFAEGGAFYSVDSDPDWPDTQLHFIPSIVEDHGRKIQTGYGISCHVCTLRPESSGSVKLASNDPFEAPVIDPKFLSSDIDANRLLKGVKKAREIMASAPIANKITKDLTCAEANTDEQLMQIIRERTDTVYHPIGTCRMGGDSASVVDLELKVRGVENLRVVDASVMPHLISSNTNAPTIAIAEKAADLIKES